MIKSRRTRWAEHVASTREMRNIQILVKNVKGRRPVYRWEDTIRMDLRKIWYKVMD